MPLPKKNKQTNHKSTSKTKKYKVRWPRVILLSFLALTLISCIIVGVFVLTALKDLPDIDNFDFDSYDATTKIMDMDGNYIDKLTSAENRTPVEFHEISPNMIAAIVAIEDQRFYTHNGVDPIRIGGALVANLKAGRTVQGGSTITQQLVGLVLLDRNEKSYTRKIREAVLAIQLENRYSKDEILTQYLNRAYFGRSAYGIEAASHEFFNKSAAELTVEESALLAGMIQNPSKWSPTRDPNTNAMTRRNVVLDQMVDIGYLTQEECANFQAMDIVLNLGGNKTVNAEGKDIDPYQSFVDVVFEEALVALGLEDNEGKLYTGGYMIYTTMDSDLQEFMATYYNTDSNFPKSEGDALLQSAAVIVDPTSGEVRGLMGGRNVTGARSLNRVTQSYRQTGSSLKPIVVYAPAFEEGYSPGSVEDDYPVLYGEGEDAHVFNNTNNNCKGLMTYREAIKGSVNTVAVKVLEKIGVSTGYNFAEKLGITTLVPSGESNDKNLSLALGGLTKGISPMELAGAYSAFANEGIYIKPHTITKITTMDGDILYEANPEKHVAMSETTAYMVNDCLSSVTDEAGGTGSRAKLDGRETAGKTGTTSERRDFWFAGYTPQYTCVVWMGYDQPKKVNNVTSSGGSCGVIFKNLMEYAHRDAPIATFERPEEIIDVTIDTKSGLLPSDLTPAEYQRSELYTKETAPTEISSVWTIADICPTSGELYSDQCHTVPQRKVVLQRQIPWQDNIAPEVEPPADKDLEMPILCTVHNGTASAGGVFQVTAKPENNAAEISWNAITGEQIIYQLHRATNPDFLNSTMIYSGSELFYRDTNVQNGSTYYYYVVACNGITATPINASKQTSVTVGAQNTSEPQKPETVTFTLNATPSHGTGRVVLQWNSPGKGEYQYYLFRSDNPNFTPGSSNQIGKENAIYDNAYSDTVERVGTYHYIIIANDKSTGAQVAQTNVSVTVE